MRQNTPIEPLGPPGRGRVGRLLACALVLMGGPGGIVLAQPVTIPLGDIDLTQMATSAPAITSAQLVKWRTGQPNAVPVAASDLSVAYLGTTGAVGFPSRTSVKDNSANNQGSLWTDDAIAVDYQKGNQLNQAILIYTDNQVASFTPHDPLGDLNFKGGLVGGAGCAQTDACYAYRGSLLTLFWKAVVLSDLQAVSDASADKPIPATSPMFMPTQVADPSNPACPAEGPYPASQRPALYEIGFCDYSTHFFVDKNNANDMFYTAYASGSASRLNAFRYASLVGPFGINVTENGSGGGGSQSPMYAVLGINLVQALPTKYATTIYVNVLQL